MITYNNAHRMLYSPISKMTRQELLQYKALLLDALKESCAEYGILQAVETGFYIQKSPTRYVHFDSTITEKIQRRIVKTNKALEQFRAPADV